MPYLGDALRLRRSPYMGAVRRTIPGASRRYKRSGKPFGKSLAASPASIRAAESLPAYTPRFVFLLITWIGGFSDAFEWLSVIYSGNLCVVLLFFIIVVQVAVKEFLAIFCGIVIAKFSETVFQNFILCVSYTFNNFYLFFYFNSDNLTCISHVFIIYFKFVKSENTL